MRAHNIHISTHGYLRISYRFLLCSMQDARWSGSHQSFSVTLSLPIKVRIAATRLRSTEGAARSIDELEGAQTIQSRLC